MNEYGHSLDISGTGLNGIIRAGTGCRAGATRAGLGLGADDYIVKPFGYKELVTRVKAALSRARRARGEDHAERRPVLDRAAGVHELGLAQDFTSRGLGGCAQADKGRVADRVGQIGSDGH